MVQVKEIVRHGVILMTALPPTIGHKNLIDFAHNFLKHRDPNSVLSVIVSGRSCEPIPGVLRYAALTEHYQHNPNIKVYYHHEDAAPQQPKSEDDAGFWFYWNAVISNITEHHPYYVFASEDYGKKVAILLPGEFIPYNPGRNILNIRASEIRELLPHSFEYILPEMQKHLRRTVTIFGAESTGKTTMTRRLAHGMGGYCIPEWAREYLETMKDQTITDEKMEAIFDGQYAYQMSAKQLMGKAYIFQDTDLFSTIGYYLIYKKQVPARCHEIAKRMRSQLYIVMNSRIPFEPDPLRYGGNKRESDDQFWIYLLDSYGCNYYVVQETDSNKQYLEIEKVINDQLNYKRIRNFKRE